MTTKPQSFPVDGLVTIKDICAYLNTTRTTWYRKMKTGEAPRPFKLFGSQKMSRWNAADVRAIKERWENAG